MKQKGFTLIEIMIVIAIIGILSMIALPAYQDYTKRTHIAEGLHMASAAKNSMINIFSTKGGLYNDNGDLNRAYGIGITKGSAVESLTIGATGAPNVITITYKANVKEIDDPAYIQLYMIANDSKKQISGVRWYCKPSDNIKRAWLPNSCVNSYEKESDLVWDGPTIDP